MFGNILASLHPILSLSISFVFLVIASWCVGEGGEILGDKYDASVIGGILIAWLNTAPETIFFVTALESSNPKFAVGAVSGSSIVVCTIAMGAVYYFGTKSRRDHSFYLQKNVKRQCLLLLVSVVIPILMAWIGFHYLLTILGCGTYIAFLIFEITKTKEVHHVAEHDHVKVDVETAEDSSSGIEQPLWKGIGYLLLGGSMILLFSEPFIEAVVDIAELAKVNPILLAFFLAPVASEMPEILESISLSRKGHRQSINVAVSNLMGGTITKTTLLCGIFSYYGVANSYAWESPNYTLSLGLLSFCAAVSASTGYFFSHQKTIHAYILAGVFVVTGVIQYVFNSHYVEVITPELDKL